MIEIPLIQGSEKWLTWKKHSLGSTSCSILMNLNRYETVKTLWHALNGNKISVKNEIEVEHGRNTEDDARIALEKHVGEKFTPKCGIHEEYAFISASLDGITEDGKIICEIKSPFNFHNFSNQLKKITPMYYAQIQHQLEVSKAELAIFWTYFEKNHGMHIIYPNKEFIHEMLYREKYFYSCYINKSEPDWKIFRTYEI